MRGTNNRLTLAVIALCLSLLSIFSNRPTVRLVTERYYRVQRPADDQNATERVIKAAFNAEEWEANEVTKNCFYIEDVCHSARHWFYRATDDPSKKQPNVTFKQYDPKKASNSGYKSEIQIEALPQNETLRLRCSNSPIPNHILLFGWYNDMLGEFYERSILGLWHLLTAQQHDLDDFIEQTQLYVHPYNPSKPLLDSHHLFTDAFRSHPLLDSRVLLDDISCRCLDRLFFCSSETSVDNLTGRITVEPRASVLPKSPRLGSPARAQLRNFLRERVILNNTLLHQAIQDYRKHLLDENDVPELLQDTMDWKIVGLAQRNVRRSWRNLTNVKRDIRRRLLKHRIIVEIVNVEDADSSSYHQVLRHGALDALIGIHGAQLTEAVWMKPGSLVVELLPYIPEGIGYGRWVKTTSSPTPLGVIFDETDLQHVGYPLDRDSAPYCYNRTELGCWMLSPPAGYVDGGHTWDERDFLFPADKVEMTIRRFLIDKPVTCEDYQTQAGKDFVLYNINCASNGTKAVTPHHFYWKST